MDGLGANLGGLGTNLASLGPNLGGLGANLGGLGANLAGLGANLGGLGARCRKATLRGKRSVSGLSVELPKGRESPRDWRVHLAELWRKFERLSVPKRNSLTLVIEYILLCHITHSLLLITDYLHNFL